MRLVERKQDPDANTRSLPKVWINPHALDRFRERTRQPNLTNAQVISMIEKGVRDGVEFVERRHNGSVMFHCPSIFVDVIAIKMRDRWDIATIGCTRWEREPEYYVDPLRRNG